MVCAQRRLQVLLVMPESSIERRKIMLAYGAVILTPAKLATDGAIEKAILWPGKTYLVTVQQPGQLAGALQRHSAGNLGADQGPGDRCHFTMGTSGCHGAVPLVFPGPSSGGAGGLPWSPARVTKFRA